MIHKKTHKYKELFTTICIIAGVMNLGVILLVSFIGVLNLVMYIINAGVSFTFLYQVKDLKFNTSNREFFLYNITLHLTILLTLFFSIINILEYFEILQPISNR